MPTARSQAEVWGSPISHSLSPALHRAAYGVLGLDKTYEPQEVTELTLERTWAAHYPELFGLSLTMPLKSGIVALVADHDPVVDILGVANTVYFKQETARLANTDPWGVWGALREHDVVARRPWILGAGATARAVGYGLMLQSSQQVTLVVRSRERAAATTKVLSGLGLEVAVVLATELDDQATPDLVVSTLPGGVDAPFVLPDSAIAHAPLLDVAYHPWPSALATSWSESSKPVISGVWMLVHQALMQIRLFTQASMETPLADEEQVLEAMKHAAGLAPVE
ncbi:MAG: hypothetical protein QNL06_00840 [Pontimonas sp.]